MCGIVGYIGHQEAYPILLEGLKRLEYRGYDSAGIALMNGGIHIHKKQGKVAVLEEHVGPEYDPCTIGMGHTRWATHGEPNDINAHPHLSESGRFAIIHNGIIENYSTLKHRLIELGYSFRSGTDTEVLVQLIDMFYERGNLSAEEAVRMLYV